MPIQVTASVWLWPVSTTVLPVLALTSPIQWSAAGVTIVGLGRVPSMRGPVLHARDQLVLDDAGVPREGQYPDLLAAADGVPALLNSSANLGSRAEFIMWSLPQWTTATLFGPMVGI